MAGPAGRERGRAGRITALAITLLVVVAYATARDLPLFRTVELQALNWRFQLRGPIEPGSETVILAIDDRTVAALGQWPLSRRDLAAAVEALTADGARVIAFDLLFTDRRAAPGAESAPEDPLADALAGSTNTVVPFAFVFDAVEANVIEPPPAVTRSAYRITRQASHGLPELPLLPVGIFAPLSLLPAAAASGHVSVLLESDGSLHSEYPVVAYGDAFYPSLPIEAARLYLGIGKDDVAVHFGEGIALGDRFLETDQGMRATVNHYGPGRTFQTLSFIDLVEGRVPAGTFSGRIVLIGSTALGIGDTFVTPFTGTLPGAEHHATVVDNILHDRLLVQSDLAAALDVLAIIVCGLLAAALAAAGSPLVATLSGAALLAAWGAASAAAFVWAGLWLNMLFPGLAVVLTFTALAVSRSLREQGLRRKAERQRANLARYLPSSITAQLADTDRPFTHDQAQHAAVMFIDMVGFTKLSEDLTPAAAISLLRHFHALVEQAVYSHHGMIDKYLGDGAMACFGVPESGPEDAHNALACARRLAEEVAAWSSTREAEGQKPIRIGIGLHYGAVIAGELGGEKHQHYTVTGDAVNVASRLEALTRNHGVTVIASDTLIEAARASSDPQVVEGFAALPIQELRGRQRPIGVWVWPPPDAAAG